MTKVTFKTLVAAVTGIAPRPLAEFFHNNASANPPGCTRLIRFRPLLLTLSLQILVHTRKRERQVASTQMKNWEG